MVAPESLPESEETQVTSLTQTQVENINAQTVSMNQSAVEHLTAEQVDLEKSAAGDVNANQINASQSVLGEVKASEVVADRSMIGYVQAERAAVSGFTGAIISQSADVRGSAAVAVIANDVKFDDSARTILLVSNNVQGNVTTLMDTRTALIAGLVAGLFASISVLLGRALFSRK